MYLILSNERKIFMSGEEYRNELFCSLQIMRLLLDTMKSLWLGSLKE